MLTEIKNSLAVLNDKGIIVYPTDTVWGIGCDATNKEAVASVFSIKQRSESKSLIILVDDIKMLKKVVPSISEQVLSYLGKLEKPTTIIYKNPIGLSNNVIAKDNTVAIRIVQNEFCKQLISKFRKPIVSTSANISGNPTPKSYKEIDTAILDSADYVVNLHREEVSTKSSSILKENENGELIVLRK